MSLKQTPVCDFDCPAYEFNLPGVDGRNWTLKECQGEKATLVMFICNHCPYVKSIQQNLVRDTKELLDFGVRSVAIMSNDPTDYSEDSFENMKIIAEKLSFPFPYLMDETQEIARQYGAVCTPDFFGYNSDLELQYRGRLDASTTVTAPADARRDLFEAMKTIAATGKGPKHQRISQGCSIKWKN